MKFSNISRSMFGALLASFFLTTSSITQAFDERLKRDAFGNAASGGVTDDVNRDLKNLLVDPVTGELLTKSSTTITGGATEVKQDDIITQLLAILTKIIADPATEATVAAILTKIILTPATEGKQDTNITNTTAIELNTDSPTNFGFANVTVTSTATLILGADPNRRSALIRNADSNTILFTGPTSGVTTANGMPFAASGVPGATGNGGTIIYTHTAAIWGITLVSQTADVRVQTESD